MTRCIARESLTQIEASPPGTTTRASQRDGPPADRLLQTRGRPARPAEASTTRDPRRAVPLLRIVPAPRTRATAPLAPVAGPIRAIAAATRTPDRAEATPLRTAVEASPVQLQLREAIQVHAPAAEHPVAPAGLQRVPAEGGRSEGAARARLEAAVTVVADNGSRRRRALNQPASLPGQNSG